LLSIAQSFHQRYWIQNIYKHFVIVRYIASDLFVYTCSIFPVTRSCEDTTNVFSLLSNIGLIDAARLLGSLTAVLA